MKQAAKDDANLVPATLAAVQSMATEGEILDTLRDVYRRVPRSGRVLAIGINIDTRTKNLVGTFSVELEVGNPSREEFVAVEALVDTGAIYNMLPEDLLDRLGSPPAGNGYISNSQTISLVEYWIGDAVVRLQGRMRSVPVVFARPDNTPLLRATTLEIFRLVADPVNDQLIPAPRIRARFF